MTMTYPLPLFAQRICRYQYDFINLPESEQTSKYLQSKFLRIWSNYGYSVGRFLEITDNGETVDIEEIFDIENRMELLFQEWEFVFDVVKKYPEMVNIFRDKLK